MAMIYLCNSFQVKQKHGGVCRTSRQEDQMARIVEIASSGVYSKNVLSLMTRTSLWAEISLK